MNELYKLLVNIQEIAKANNMFLQGIDQRISTLESELSAIKESLVLDLQPSEPTAAGAETIGQ